MCGRYITPAESDLERHWHLTPDLDYRQIFNVTPGLDLPVVRLDDEGRTILARHGWGFQPAWAKRGWINARSETAFESKAFASAAKRRRCLVPAIGWYEWQGAKPPKQPWCFHLAGLKPFSFAGIWTARETEDGTAFSFAILTRAASSYLADIHDRMPVLLRPDDYGAWLSPDTTDPQSLIGEPYERIETHRVSTRVNKPQNQGPECIAPVDG